MTDGGPGGAAVRFFMAPFTIKKGGSESLTLVQQSPSALVTSH